MSWRIVKLSSRGRLTLKQNQLCFHLLETEEDFSFPLEEIGVVILENLQTTITTALLSELAEQNISVITCDVKHRPNAVLTAFSKHSHQSEITRKQIEMSLPLKKRLWQKIVQQKIRNQAAVLRFYAKENDSLLQTIAGKVLSGDEKNAEAFAASIYWKSLFGKDFVRHAEDAVNAALNYGYAVIRSVLIEKIAVHGMIPCLGIHHDSVLNAYNLADDLIEPFRAFVDKSVYAAVDDWSDELTKENRESLIAVLQCECRLNGHKTSLLNGIDEAVSSFVQAIKGKDESELFLPEMMTKTDD